MAVSEYKQALLDSLSTDEERAIINGYYKMSRSSLLESYGNNIDELAKGFHKTRLWDHQKDNITYRRNRLQKSLPPKGLITVLPAGAGKTEVFVQTVLANAREVTEDGHVKLITPPTVILVPSIDLIQQTYNELKERAPNLLMGCDYAKEKNTRPLTITTYDTFCDKVNEGKIKPGDISLMVMDEGHRGLSENRLQVFQRFVNNSLIDAYSASPAFDAMKNLYELLGKESVIPSPTDRELTNKGFLAECHNVLLRVKVNTEDLPPVLLNNPERYNDFLEELKIHAAKEFYLTYRDKETKQSAFGKPAVAFTRYVKHAERAAEVFNQALSEHAADDVRALKVMDKYTHPTQVLSRSLGDDEVDAAFDRLLPPQKRKNDKGENNLITCTTKMAREGTNIPQWKVALGLHTPNSSVEQVQTRGRVRRKRGDELSYALDVFIEEDGEIKGKPKFYYEAIDDPAIVRGVVTFTPNEEDIQKIANHVLEYKNKKEMKELVIGNGKAASAYASKFNELWDEISEYLHAESKKKEPKPYILDKEPLDYQLVTHYREDDEGSLKQGRAKVELHINQKAVDQFRYSLGMPGQMNGKWRDEKAFAEAVIGKNEHAEYYKSTFDDLLEEAKRHIEAHRRHPKLFDVAGQSVRIEERLSEQGDLIPAFHNDAVLAFKAALDVAPNKSTRFKNKQEFEQAVLEGVDDTGALKSRLSQLWNEAGVSYRKSYKSGQRCMISIDDTKVEAANCFIGDGRFEFCLDHRAISAARRALGIAEITYDLDTISWDREIAAVEHITKLRDNGQYPDLEPGMLGVVKMAERIGTTEVVISPAYKALEKEWKKRGPVFDHGKHQYVMTKGNDGPIRAKVDWRTYTIPADKCGMFIMGTAPYFCIHESQSQEMPFAPNISDKMLIYSKMGPKAGINPATVKPVYDALETEWKKREPVFDYVNKCYVATACGQEPLRVTLENKTYTVPIEKCGIFRSGSLYPFCIDESQYFRFEKAPPIKSHMLVSKNMAEEAHVGGLLLVPVYKALEIEWKKRKPYYDYEKEQYIPTEGGNAPLQVTVADKTYVVPIEECGIFRSGSHYPFCINKAQSYKFEICPQVKSGMSAYGAMAKELKKSGRNLKLAFDAIESEWKKRKPIYDYENERYVVTSGGQEPLLIGAKDRVFEIPLEECGEFQFGPKPAFYVNKSLSSVIVEMAEILRDAQKGGGGKAQGEGFASEAPTGTIRPDANDRDGRNAQRRWTKD